MQPCNEGDREDCRQYENTFKSKLLKRCPQLTLDNIRYNIEGNGTGDPADESQEGGQGDAASGAELAQHEERPEGKEWIRELTPFTSFLQNLRLDEEKKTPKIKVAILDDGVKLEIATDSHKRDFKDLVAQIVKAKKPILFYSLPDTGPNFDTRPFGPVGLKGIIRICSTTDFDAISQDNIYAKPEFLLPGENH
ncbi:hypothetical protein B0T21DRAFT_413739 [Apiosordaria backusii]|uniref:Uncharacterized protein n=1 Tax=Apiosordaria backusii TaxID=314023 RepID=A0AA40B2E9_9PEZI|nr:hypothetical protein B0T21DRAFT_413739 [Apiosordaria backusii]